jgi:predicted nucleotide-binding protein
MNKAEAIDILRDSLKEIPKLEKLPHNNREYKLWKSKVEEITKNVLGKEDLVTFGNCNLQIPVFDGFTTDAVRQDWYRRRLNEQGVNIEKIIQKYELLGVETKPTVSEAQHPKAFIAHGGKSEALDKLKEFLVSLGVKPLVVEEQASENRSVGNNVDSYARQADCAIILATKGDIDGLTGSFIPRGNVLIEIGKAQELFKDSIIYLLQAGTKFPTDISEKVWGRFTSSCMDEAFIKVARELAAFGILKTVKPSPKKQIP